VEWWNPDNFYYPEHGTCACLNYSEIATEKVYDVVQGSGAGPGSLLRRTETSYKFQDSGGQTYADAGMTSLPSSVTVYDANGAQKAQATYSYDESAYSSGLVAGELTTNSRWIVGQSWASTHTKVSASGSWAGSVDANGNSTIVTSYACSGLAPSNVTLASGTSIAESVSYGYDCNTGKPTSYTDPNNNTTTYSYADPLNRLTKITPPPTVDGGQWGQTGSASTTLTYTDSPSGWSVQKQLLQSTDGTTLTATEAYDGLGRLTSSALNDTAGNINRTTDYDLMGRLYHVYNPFRSTSDPTYGPTTYGYDEIGRMKSKTNPDNSSQSWTYSGNTVTHKDESGNQWLLVNDGLGRLTNVVEDPQGLGLHTDYTYNALGNLTSVFQHGTSAESARTRGFIYDGLSRLTSASNPETGTIGYSYVDLNGALCSGDVSLPCSKKDARNIRISYQYDALNRLTQKSYSNGDPTAQYFYDVLEWPAGPACGTSWVSQCNIIGRLSWEQTVSPATGAIQTKTNSVMMPRVDSWRSSNNQIPFVILVSVLSTHMI
jgi:YD repeat-containing protein